MKTVDPDAWDRLSTYLRATRRCTTPAELGNGAVQHLQDVTGAGWSECVQAAAGGRVTVLASSDPDLTDVLLRARDASEEPPDPGVMADETVTIEDLAVSSPWPVFAERATAETPVRSAVLPYFSTTTSTGVLTVVDRRPGHFGPAEQAYARLVADLFALQLDRLETSARAAHLERAARSGRLVGTACGVLAVRRDISPEESFALLRVVSQRSNRRLRDLADDVLLTGDLP